MDLLEMKIRVDAVNAIYDLAKWLEEGQPDAPDDTFFAADRLAAIAATAGFETVGLTYYLLGFPGAAFDELENQLT